MDIVTAVPAFLSSPEMGHTSEKTLQNYRYILENRMLPFCRDHQIFTTAEMANSLRLFCDVLEDDWVKGKTIQGYIGRVRQFLAYCGEKTEFVYRIKREERMASQEKARGRWLNEQDIRHCLHYRFQANHDRNHLMIRILVECGPRVGELVQIRAGDIFPEEGAIWLSNSKTMMRWIIPSPKTMERLSAMRILLNKTDRLFPISEKQVYRIISDMLRDMGLKNGDDGRAPHVFRHWCATHMVFALGMRVEDVAMLLGDTPQTIRETYLHPTPSMLRKRVFAATGWQTP